MTEVFENPNPTTQPDVIPEKKKRKRKPLTPSKKKALVERLAKARQAKKEKAKKEETPKVEVPKADAPINKETPVQPKPLEKPKVSDRERERQLELANLRHELELQKLKNELEDARKPRRKPKNKTLEDEEEEPKPKVEKKPNVSIVQEDKAIPQKPKPIVNTPPPKPQKIIGRLAPRNIWNF